MKQKYKNEALEQLTVKQTQTTREHLLNQYQMYSEVRTEDIFKFLHQSTFGCEHMVSSPEKATELIRSEALALKASPHAHIEKLDGKFTRVYLQYLNRGLSAETLGRLFYLSAKAPKGTREILEEKLKTVATLIKEGLLPFEEKEFLNACEKWKAKGYPALHHSHTFKKAYMPSYRVISDEYVPLLPLLSKIDSMNEKPTVTVAIDGGSGSGKTTLANLLQQLYDCNIFHMDDFFLQSHQRTSERYKQPGGNVDRERFLTEVLIPLTKCEEVVYHPFDCSCAELLSPISVTPKRLNIIEGAYSLHPEMREHYDISVFLDIGTDLQKKRINKRNTPETAEMFFNKWIPLENTYFSFFDVKNSCDFIITSTDI